MIRFTQNKMKIILNPLLFLLNLLLPKREKFRKVKRYYYFKSQKCEEIFSYEGSLTNPQDTFPQLAVESLI